MFMNEWSEEPRCLLEALALEAAPSAATRPVNWKGATKEPFLTLESEGWTKQEFVIRTETRTSTVHLWEGREGQRAHFKVKTK